MGDPKWEDLPFDCLVDIFTRVGWVSLVEGVPYVCKSWYQVTLSPLCWQSLIFAHDFPGPFPLESSFVSLRSTFLDDQRRHSLEAFIKFVIRRSHGSANVVAFPDDFRMTQEVLGHIGEGCPSLKKLVLGCELFDDGLNVMLSRMIHKWRNLEALEIHSSGYLLNDIIPQISVHCKNFVSLSAIEVGFRETEANAIVTLLPNIEFLSLRESMIERSAVLMILKGCKNLTYLDISNDFVVDDEILNLSANIPTFKFKDCYCKSESESEFCDYSYCLAWNYGDTSFDNEGGNYSSDEGYCEAWEYEGLGSYK